MNVQLERLDPERVDWRRLDAFDDRVVFQTREWLAFVAETQGAEPVVCAVRRDGEVGCFTGLIARRFGIRILGSPFPGWTTGYMGFNLDQDVSRRERCGVALVRFARESRLRPRRATRSRPRASAPTRRRV